MTRDQMLHASILHATKCRMRPIVVRPNDRDELTLDEITTTKLRDTSAYGTRVVES